MILSPNPIGKHENHLTKDDVHVWYADLTRAPENLAGVLKLLDQNEQARAARLRGEMDRAQYIAAHGTARVLLASYLGCSPRSIRFGYASRGKPYVIHTESEVNLRFNASRTIGLAVFALSIEREVGVDVERLRFDHSLVDTAWLALSDQERTALGAVTSKMERYTRFLSAWARKEAYLKACGDGLTISSASIHTEPDLGQVYVCGRLQHHWRVYDLAGLGGYFAAVAAEGEQWHETLREFSISSMATFLEQD